MSHNYSESTDDVSRTAPDRVDHYVLGDDAVGVAVARGLRKAGHTVAVVGDTVGAADLPVVEAAPTDTAALRAAGLADAVTVIVATRSDGRNLLLAQLVRARFDGLRVVVLANADDQVDLFTDAGHEPICVTSAIADAVADRV